MERRFGVAVSAGLSESGNIPPHVQDAISMQQKRIVMSRGARLSSISRSTGLGPYSW